MSGCLLQQGNFPFECAKAVAQFADAFLCPDGARDKPDGEGNNTPDDEQDEKYDAFHKFIMAATYPPLPDNTKSKKLMGTLS
jgi:hypothetical protein